ncbi:3-oxo-5-alpha-steroid 4-dehydrogenase [Rhizoctonia solani]|uniref:3-oxo-5-alpha-steroid 4-dehydrogenase n=1 Tax=Rhizoctonia solani TaxID=456999 RepID=A0A8H8P1M8_9AGAM|nr:3-oxo-5-alpha-steroid 4-dehydrogenase [Rhizoctonia solani]QRW22687.1 3-oxo-5-alpha-steroid 4-dehydrogenase [Rhizoctonia solani]
MVAFPDSSSSKGWITRAWNALSLDGTFSWIIMELPSPITLLYAFSQQTKLSDLLPLSLTPHSVLPLLFVGHYLNRAIISPLRTPSRSRSHLVVVLAAIVFNTINGSVNGTWLGVGARTGSLGWADVPTSYWVGVAMFGLGLWGNIWHDEVLLKIRKDKDGFALASGSITTRLQESLTLGRYGGVYITPTLLFVLVEVALMLPRAQRGHEWYHEKFDDYPKERKAVIPFLL